MNVRIKFTKTGAAKFIGHLDVMRYFQKAIRRAGIAILYSGGFSPHQKMSFAAPLGVGITSSGEYLDIEVEDSEDVSTMKDRLNQTMAEGFGIKSCRVLPENAGNAMSLVAAASYTLTFRSGYAPQNSAQWMQELVDFYRQEQVLITKKTKKGQKELDLKPLVYQLQLSAKRIDSSEETPVLSMMISTGSAENIKPELVLDAYYQHLGQERPAFAFAVQREEVYAKKDPAKEGPCQAGDFLSLEDFGEISPTGQIHSAGSPVKPAQGENDLNKLIITRWKEHICTALADERKVVQINLEPEKSKTLLNNIYIGKVQNIKKNINSAFIDIGKGVTGYYSITDNPEPVFAQETASVLTQKTSGQNLRKLKAGDELIVQVAKDAVKTKSLVLTSRITLTGKFTVLTLGKPGVGFSSKIHSPAWKAEIRPYLQQETEERFSIIVRTNGKDASLSELLEEICQLKTQLNDILAKAPSRSCYSLLYKGPEAFLTGIRNAYADQLEEIVTDDAELFSQMEEFLRQNQPEDEKKLRFYQDDLLPLGKLYQLEKIMEECLAKRVWLKSGGYLVIEPTEALVVIDVNTGKYSEKKTVKETILKINLEAAEEIGRQLRLRNLSGIILVDFIDMEEEEHKSLLLEHLEKVVRNDPIKTNVVDITRLNLVELTRKKIQRPLYEQLDGLV